jgi:hypothetical protein
MIALATTQNQLNCFETYIPGGIKSSLWVVFSKIINKKNGNGAFSHQNLVEVSNPQRKEILYVC